MKIGFIETHNRAETQALVAGLPIIPRRKLFYKGRELEEMDLQAILNLHPELVIVDELAHTNIPGSKNEKRWQDVLDILDAGINVISAVNIQHIESLYDEVRNVTGIDVTERVPDRVLQRADEVVNIDLTADELIARLKEGKIYDPAKVETALANFFKPEKILHLRELALREVASAVERKIEVTMPVSGQTRNRAVSGLHQHQPRHGPACYSENGPTGQLITNRAGTFCMYRPPPKPPTASGSTRSGT